MSDRRPTLPLEPAANRVLEDVVAVTGVSAEAIVGTCRTAKIVDARRAWRWLTREITGAPYMAIAVLAQRDHATVMLGIRRALEPCTRRIIEAVIARGLERREEVDHAA